MEIGSITSQYFWRNDQFIQREVKVYEYPDGQKKEVVSELILYNRYRKEEVYTPSTIDKLI